jgi:hypothetical protein
MKKFKEHLDEGYKIKEEELNDWISVFTWEEISDLYEEEEFEKEEPVTLSEKISASTRLRKGQQLKSRGSRLAVAKQMKLLRTSSPEVLGARAKAAARRMLMQKFLQGKDKGTLSAQERDRLEQRVSSIIKMQPALVVKMTQKVRTLERSRLAGKNKKK